MTGDLQILITMCVYMAVVIGIGVFFARFANQNSENFFIGGRSLGPWVAAMSAEASDMSGWLLMGLPGVAYWSGLADATWTAIGLAIGTYINWLLVSKRLRRYSAVAKDSITIPDFFSNRFHEKKNKVLMSIAAVFILIFFTVYAASCFVTCGKLFSTLFGQSYQLMMLLGVLFVIVYTFLGGFLAESISDFMQGVIMIVVLSLTMIAMVAAAGGVSQIFANIKDIPGFLDFFGTATPVVTDGVQQVSNLQPLFAEAGTYGFLTVASTLSWGLGYFGMPQVLLRFMAIRDEKELGKSRRVAMVWVMISLAAAVCIGLVGRALYPTELLTKGGAEQIFILAATNLLPTLLAGLAMAGILAATISSSDSYLLIAASSVAKNLFKGIVKKDATDKQIMRVTRITLVLIAVVGALIALDENSIIFTIVSFAWAGFGATFGPIMLFSLFWKRTTRQGAIAGMLTGGVSVFVWNALERFGGIFTIYELLPAFILSSVAIVVGSLLSEEPSAEMQAEFEAARG